MHSIRVILPYHLQVLAQIDSEVSIDLEGPVTPESIVDTIEARFPMLRGTIRDHVTRKRRPMLRYFACEKDISHDPADTPVPEAVLTGVEPFIIWGAIAGG